MNNKISNKDKKDWENFLSNKDHLPDKDNIQNNKKVKKKKSLDLHGYSLDNANKVLEDFIKKSYEEKIFKLIIVTGKGLHSDNEKNPYVSKDLSILKYSIPEFVKNNSELMKIISDIKEASIEDGGSGAFYIYLKKK
ncbi:Smr/MutS family protein [Candidatus Pelagibacter sp. HIMB1483]|uniref:Smr/MutS family protein n=1 Tax=Candidatus Pelagibacter sp. HIMB1483 TaxID=3415414 RepID=UPI003F83FB7F